MHKIFTFVIEFLKASVLIILLNISFFAGQPETKALQPGNIQIVTNISRIDELSMITIHAPCCLRSFLIIDDSKIHAVNDC